VEEHSNKQRTPYLFTAKELDEASQLYYFGARYYDPRTSIWQSADPILGKYLGGDPGELPGIGGAFNSRNLSLYSYTHNNPVNLVDPDGNVVKKIAEVFAKISSKYDNYQCDSCAREMVDAAQEMGLDGKLIKVNGSSPGNIYSDKAQKAITKDGSQQHYAVELDFDEKVRDNHTPEGVGFDDFKDDLVNMYDDLEFEKIAFGVKNGYSKAKNAILSVGAVTISVLGDEAEAAVNNPAKAIFDWSPLSDVWDAIKIEGTGGCDSNGMCSDMLYPQAETEGQ